jgi:ABC-type polysaccharide/polyol phosphate transport system ATPase subunit
VIEFDGVSKSYSIYESPGDRLKELITFNRLEFHKNFWALHDVSFRIERGETFCIVGENGSGKSTLLQLIAGILRPTEGKVTVEGRVSALLELGAGFNPEFSGRDNVYLNGSILGLSTRDIDERYGDIAAFAEIGDFINRPVKTYSSGMVVRLAFAVAIHVDPEVHELRARGVTIVFVSHSAADVKALGDRTLWLDCGRVVEIGATGGVIARYLAAMVEKDSAYLAHKPADRRPAGPSIEAPEVAEVIPNVDHRYGDGRAKVLGIAVLDTNGRNVQLLEPLGQIVVRISVRASQDVGRPIVGFMIRNHLGVDFAGTNTAREGCELAPMSAGDVSTVDFYIELPELYPGSFSLSPAIADGTLDGYHMCDWIDNAITLQMGHGDGQIYGFLHLPCRVAVNTALQTGATTTAPEIK